MMRRSFKIVVLAILLPLLFDRGALGQSVDVDALVEQAEITGISLVVIEDGEISHSVQSGIRSSTTNPPITADTVFEAESLSKPVVAYIALLMEEDGQLDLDKPLAEYVTYRDAEHDSRYLRITARMVLSHSSGFPNFRPPGESLSIGFEPGTFFTYSGEGFLFLQKALERISFKSLEELAWVYVFDPLEMTSTSFVWQTEFGKNIAVGHTDMGIPLDKFVPQTANAAFSLHTTPTDYARFMLAVERGEGLGRKNRRDMRTAQMDALDGVFWGLGWGLQPTLSGQAIWQWGDNAGYKTFAYLEPEAKKGIIIMSNSANGMLILHALFEEFIGGPQTAIRWLNYQQYDDPQYQLGRRLHYAIIGGGIEEARTAFDESRADLPAEAFEEGALNSLGYRLLRQGLIDHAVDIFEFNSEMYPESANASDSFGEGLYAAGRLEEALEQYRHVLRLQPSNMSASSMIRVIESKLASRN